MLVPIYQTTWCHIYEDSNIYIRHRDSLTVHKKLIFSAKLEFCNAFRNISLSLDPMLKFCHDLYSLGHNVCSRVPIRRVQVNQNGLKMDGT